MKISESNLFYSTNANGKKELTKKLFLTLKGESSSFDYYCFGMSCYLELSQILFFTNFVKDTVLETIIYFEETLILAIDKTSP